ncbi:hypothetical protein GTV32_01740 [Gordonia sp. SID5947]|uniref:hypothetical protein n=1 Tax=Gordonia sp. SID5947 TaxID=2690315 RepID=UPI00136D831A|nr:hypothetical protein [Gordonia sp. SID5947]MYR05132.1 hypothetical protein [Gordonia sp. SID5947]
MIASRSSSGITSSEPIEQWGIHMAAEGKARRSITDRTATLRRVERDSGTTALSATTGDLAAWLGRPDRALVESLCAHQSLRTRASFLRAEGTMCFLDFEMVNTDAVEQKAVGRR